MQDIIDGGIIDVCATTNSAIQGQTFKRQTMKVISHDKLIYILLPETFGAGLGFSTVSAGSGRLLEFHRAYLSTLLYKPITVIIDLKL